MKQNRKTSRFRARALLREQRRREKSAPFARVKGMKRLIAASTHTNSDLVIWLHPTKGHRQRRVLKGVPTFASKNDMVQVMFGTIAKAMMRPHSTP